MAAETEFSFPYSSNTFYILAFLPIVVAVGLVYAATQIEPAWLFYAATPIPLTIAVLFVMMGRAVNTMAVVVDSSGLTVRAGLRPRTIPITSLKLDAARQVDLSTTPELEPVRRTNGADIEGLKQGWFQLRNGEKALLILTNLQAVYIPTSEGFSVLVSPPDASAFLDTIKATRGNMRAVAP